MRYSETHKDETHAKLLKIAGRRPARKRARRRRRRRGDEGSRPHPWRLLCAFQIEGRAAGRGARRGVCEFEAEVRCARSKACRRGTRSAPISISTSRRAIATIPTSGCPITALNSDLPRQSEDIPRRLRCGREVAGRTVLRAASGDAGIEGDAQALAASVLSAMAGAVAMSRAVSDRDLSDQMLETARDEHQGAARRQRHATFPEHAAMNAITKFPEMSGLEQIARDLRRHAPAIDGIVHTLKLKPVSAEEGFVVFEGNPDKQRLQSHRHGAWRLRRDPARHARWAAPCIRA